MCDSSLLLSIVIPTKNRYLTLEQLLIVISSFLRSDNYEIVIQDNSDDNSRISNFLNRISNKNIKYFYQSGFLTVSENTSLAIGNCLGKYLLLIGDDDLVSPYIIEVIRLLETNDLDCLIYTRGNYFWPDVKFEKEYGFNYPDTLRIQRNFDLNLQYLNPDEELDKVLDNGAINLGKLPCLYHGIVKREKMEEVKNKFGSFVPGSSPDMAIAVALSFVVEKYAFVNYPVSLFGASKNSAAGLGTEGLHRNELQNVPWLPKDIIENWDPLIPKIWLGPTIYAQTIQEVLYKIGSSKRINYQRLYQTLRSFKGISTYFTHDMIVKKERKGLFRIFLQKNKKYFSSFILKLIFHLRGDLKNFSRFKGVGGYSNCNKVLIKELKINE